MTSKPSASRISIHALREEGDFSSIPVDKVSIISIHALREEGDLAVIIVSSFLPYFYPRPPRGGRHKSPLTGFPHQRISIHALREEGDVVDLLAGHALRQFLSTPSARRATCCRWGLSPGCVYFYPRPPRGGRLSRIMGATRRRLFLSTPSARRATELPIPFRVMSKISIHALREEGDPLHRAGGLGLGHFYPRPPRGGRPNCSRPFFITRLFLSTPSARRATWIPADQTHKGVDFYPRPPRGGRRESSSTSSACSLFLSTPSARRATAKTETKSLFSNKLYNILHEFRRALIYNGSKSYPNHAK